MKLRNVMPILLLGAAGSCWAADHNDAPKVRADPTADINDIYAFVNPNDANETIFVITVVPDAPAGARFSDAV